MCLHVSTLLLNSKSPVQIQDFTSSSPIVKAFFSFAYLKTNGIRSFEKCLVGRCHLLHFKSFMFNFSMQFFEISSRFANKIANLRDWKVCIEGFIVKHRVRIEDFIAIMRRGTFSLLRAIAKPSSKHFLLCCLARSPRFSLFSV